MLHRLGGNQNVGAKSQVLYPAVMYLDLLNNLTSQQKMHPRILESLQEIESRSPQRN